jgi:cobalt-zinc-cadmium efflux system outer membrane protein
MFCHNRNSNLKTKAECQTGKTDFTMIAKKNRVCGKHLRKLQALTLASFTVSLWMGTAGYSQATPQAAQVPQEAGLPKLTYSTKALTLQQVEDAAETHNPTLLSARQSLEAVRAQEIQAGVRANPYFTLYGTNVTLPAEGASNPYSYSGQVSRLFERGEKRRWRLDIARNTTQQTAEQLQDQTRQLKFSIKQAFTNMLFAKAALQLAQDNLRDFRHEVDINKVRLEQGDIDQLDFKRLDLQLAQFESDEATARTNLSQASYQLQMLAGYANPDDNFDIQGDLLPPEINDTLPSFEQKALDARPDYLAAQTAVRVADANVKLAYANGTTDPTLEGEYDRSGTYNSAGFSVSIPLRLFDKNQGNKETSKYQVTASQFAVTAAQNQVRSDVAQAWVGYKTAKALSDRYNLHYLQESRDVLSIAQFAYEHGGIALIDYLDAVRDSRSVANDALNAYAQTWLAIHQLSLATATEIIP